MVTPAMSPQVMVEIDGVPAACLSLDCDYAYFEATAIITGMVLAEDGLELTITGTGFDTSVELFDVRVGAVSCGPTTPASSTSIVCTLT